MKKLLLFLLLACGASAQIRTTNLIAKYAITDNTPTVLPDVSGNGYNGTSSDGIHYTLPAYLTTHAQTIMIFADCDRYLTSAGTVLLGNTSPIGLKMYCNLGGNDKFITVDMGTKLVGAISPTDTTITVANAERLSVGGTPYWFTVESEAINCASVTGNVFSGCARPSGVSHADAASLYGTADISNLTASTSRFTSYFSAISGSLFTIAMGSTDSRLLDNGTETLYRGFYPTASKPFTVANNNGQYTITLNVPGARIHYMLFYSDQEINSDIATTSDAVNTIVHGRGVPARTDGTYTTDMMTCEGTSIENYGSPGWCPGMSLTGFTSQDKLDTAQPGGVYSHITDYLIARDGPNVNPGASRNVIVLGAPTNDIQGGDTMANTQANYTGSITKARSIGYGEVYCSYMLSRVGSASGHTLDYWAGVWNAWLAANYVSIGCTNIMPLDARFTAPNACLASDSEPVGGLTPIPGTACSGGNCFSDEVHPNQAGYAAMSLLTAPIVNAGIVAPPPTVTLAVDSFTNTQAVLNATAANGDGTAYVGACTLRASEGISFGALVNDVNPALFVGADSDTLRNSTILNGTHRYITLGKRTAETAADNKLHERPLQQDTDHIVGLKCGTAAEATVVFHTRPIPFGNTNAEWYGYGNSWNGTATPTFDLTTKKSYLDPLTGVFIQQITGPLDNIHEMGSGVPFNSAMDLSGGAWTNVANANALQSGSNFASTSTPGAAMFLPLSQGSYYHNGYGAFEVPDDLRLKAYCNASGSATISACLTLDSGQTCATGAQVVSCPVGSFGEVDFPGTGYPSAAFNAWTPIQLLAPNMVSTVYDVENVSITGNAMTIGTNQFRAAGQFAPRAAGSKILVPGSSPTCTNNLCTVAAVPTPVSVTLAETFSAPLVSTALDQGFGVKVWQTGTGSLEANFEYDWAASAQYFDWQNGEYDACGLEQTVSVDALGAAAAPRKARLCVVGTGYTNLFLFFPDNGEFRLMSVFMKAGELATYNVPQSPFSPTDPNTLYVSDSSDNLYKGVVNSFATWKQDPFAPTVGNITWTLITGTPLATQIASYGGPTAADLATPGLFMPPKFIGIVGGRAYYQINALGDFGDRPCAEALVNPDTFTLVALVDSYNTFPMRSGSCHVGAVGNGDWMELTANPNHAHWAPNLLSGPFRLAVDKIHAGATWKTYSQPLTGVTVGTCTVFTAVASGLDSSYNTAFGTGAGVGPYVTIAGGSGAWAAANGTWVAQVSASDPDHFTVCGVNSTGFVTTLPGGMTVSAGPPMALMVASAISTGTPAVITVTFWNPNGVTGSKHWLIDGSQILFTGDVAQHLYYVKATGYPGNQFALYSDSALTSPLNGASIQSFLYNGGNLSRVMEVENCPTDLPAQWVTGMAQDSGAVGARCIQIHLTSEPCSLYASAAEHAAKPCPSDPSNTSKSMLNPIQPGDVMQDIGQSYIERITVVRKTKVSETDITLVGLRWSYNQIQGGDDHNHGGYHHDAGAGWYLGQTTPFGWSLVTDPTHTFVQGDWNLGSQHGDVGHGSGPGLFTYVSGAGIQGYVPDSISDKTIPQILSTHLTYLHSENPTFAGSTAGLSQGYHIQSYPNHRQQGIPAENAWKGDWNALNPSYGNPQTIGGNLIGGMTATLVPGMTLVYKVSNVAGAFDRKKVPPYAWVGYHATWDKSGPGSRITDADLWAFCVADFAGECVAGSAKGDAFMNMPRSYMDAGGNCYTNDYDYMQPCLINAESTMGWATQVRISPIDSSNAALRRPTLGWANPGMHFSFHNWVQGPGHWGFFSAPFINGIRNEYFAMKLPPWAGTGAHGLDDAVNRTDFQYKEHKVGLLPSVASARIRFGYQEFGTAAQYHCTSRQEACNTDIPTGSPTDPFSFESDPPNHQACSLGCSIKVPVLPAHIVYWVLEGYDMGGTLVYSQVLKPLAVY